MNQPDRPWKRALLEVQYFLSMATKLPSVGTALLSARNFEQVASLEAEQRCEQDESLRRGTGDLDVAAREAFEQWYTPGRPVMRLWTFNDYLWSETTFLYGRACILSWRQLERLEKQVHAIVNSGAPELDSYAKLLVEIDARDFVGYDLAEAERVWFGAAEMSFGECGTNRSDYARQLYQEEFGRLDHIVPPDPASAGLAQLARELSYPNFEDLQRQRAALLRFHPAPQPVLEALANWSTPEECVAILDVAIREFAEIVICGKGQHEERSRHRMEPPPPRIQITGSQIGLLSVGDRNAIREINLELSQDLGPTQAAAAEAIKNLSEAALQAQEETLRAQLLELLSEISRQVALPPERRSPRAVLMLLLRGLGEGFQSAGGLAEAWAEWGPRLTQLFGGE